MAFYSSVILSVFRNSYKDMSRSTPMKTSRKHSTGSEHPTIDTSKFELMVIGTSFKISQSESDESSNVTSSRQTRIQVRKVINLINENRWI